MLLEDGQARLLHSASHSASNGASFHLLLEDGQARLADVSYVVLDEFHYMNDPR